MTANRWTFVVLVLTGMVICPELEAQVKGDQDITGPYEVVEAVSYTHLRAHETKAEDC